MCPFLLLILLDSGAVADDLRQDVRLAQDQHLVGADLDLGASVLGEDDLVTLLHVHLDVLPVLVARAGTDGEDAAALRPLGPLCNTFWHSSLPSADADDTTAAAWCKRDPQRPRRLCYKRAWRARSRRAASSCGASEGAGGSPRYGRAAAAKTSGRSRRGSSIRAR